MNDSITAKALHLKTLHNSNNFILTTAESCTGGLISGAITDISGSSAYFDRAFISYTNTAKEQMLSVSDSTLQQYGAVSLQTVKEMAIGALNKSDATISVAVSGIAGPTGGSDLKPVGTVCIAFATDKRQVYMRTCHFTGDRSSVREATVAKALDGFIAIIEGKELKSYQAESF